MCLHLQLSLELTWRLLGKNERAASWGERPRVHLRPLCRPLILRNTLRRSRSLAPGSSLFFFAATELLGWGRRGRSAPRELAAGRSCVPFRPEQRAGAKGGRLRRLRERGALQGSEPREPESFPGDPGCNYRGAQPRDSEKKQITVQAPSILIKILSPAKPPTPVQPVPISAAGRGEQRAGLLLMKRKHSRAFKCRGRRAAPAGTARGPGSVTGSRVAGWQWRSGRAGSLSSGAGASQPAPTWNGPGIRAGETQQSQQLSQRC